MTGKSYHWLDSDYWNDNDLLTRLGNIIEIQYPKEHPWGTYSVAEYESEYFDILESFVLKVSCYIQYFLTTINQMWFKIVDFSKCMLCMFVIYFFWVVTIYNNDNTCIYIREIMNIAKIDTIHTFQSSPVVWLYTTKPKQTLKKNLLL